MSGFASARAVMDDHFAATMHLVAVTFTTRDPAVINAIDAIFEESAATQSTLQLTNESQTALHAAPQNLGVRMVPASNHHVQRERHTPRRVRKLMQRGLDFLHKTSPSSSASTRSVGDSPAPGRDTPGAGNTTNTEAAS